MTKHKTDPKNWKAGGKGRKAMAVTGVVNQNLSVPHNPLTPQRQQTFLTRLAECGNISQAASLCDGGIGSARSYRRLASVDPAFQRAMADALDGYAARVNEAVNREGLEGQMVPVVSAGEIMTDPITKKPIYIRKVSEKILLQLARSTNAAMRDHKVVTNQNGEMVSDPNDPKIILSVSDLARLDLTDSEMLIAICKKIYANRVEEFSGPDMKTISGKSDIEDVEYEDASEPIDPENPYDL